MTLWSSIRKATMGTFPLNLAATACLLSASLACPFAHGQATASDSVRVPLTASTFLPVSTDGSIQTSIATALDGQTGPWKVAFRFADQDTASGSVHYELQVTNATDQPLSLPVGADGASIWDACQDSPISEVNIDLRVPGQVAPLVSLPAAHSCAGVDASAATVLPGQSVIFTGSLPNSTVPSDPTSVSAVVSVCSATYRLDGDDPHTTRTCQAPITSDPTVSSTATVTGAQ